MELYPWLVFLHVVGGFAFVLAHGASAVVSLKLRGEHDPTRIGALLDVSAYSLGVSYAALLLLLVTGIAAGFLGDWWGRLWIWASLALLVVLFVAMGALASPYFEALRHGIGQKGMRDGKDAPPPEPLPQPELALLLTSTRPHWVTAIGAIGLLLILWLMAFKPF